jgi:RNA polymerase sigma-70 factor (ECF subfamily)
MRMQGPNPNLRLSGEGPLSGAEAFDPQAVWQQHRRWVAAILLAHMPREADVEDLLQDVAIAFVRNASSLREQSSVRPWLRTVAVNVARTHGRKQRVRRAVLGSTVDVHQDGTAGSGGGMAADEREQARVAMEMTRNLPDEYREPLMLRAVRGMSYKQIADVLGVPVTTVETRLVRARRMVREQIELHESGAQRGPGPERMP